MIVAARSRQEIDLFAPLSAEFLGQLVASNNGSDPITPWRKTCFARALVATAPTNRDEDSKYINFRLLDFEGLTSARLIAHSNGKAEDCTLITMSSEEADTLPKEFMIDSSAAEGTKGIFFGSFVEAAHVMPAELAHYLEFFSDKFPHRKMALLAHAFMNQGAFLHISQGVEKVSPRHLYTHISGGGSMISSVGLAVVEENSQGSLVWDIDSETAASGFANSTLDVIVRSGGRMSLLVNQEPATQISSAMTMRVYLEKDAAIDLVTMSSGGLLNLMEIDLQFAGEGGRAMVNGIYIGRGGENFNLLTHQNHRVGHSISDLLYLGTLAGKARSNYLGKITIAPNAQRSDAYQKNRNLVLNRGIAVNSSPKLEICANDVRCSHGATVSKISDQEMFYLRSRGIDKTNARVLLADGFLRQVSERLRSPVLRQGYEQRLQALLTRWEKNDLQSD